MMDENQSAESSTEAKDQVETVVEAEVMHDFKVQMEILLERPNNGYNVKRYFEREYMAEDMAHIAVEEADTSSCDLSEWQLKALLEDYLIDYIESRLDAQIRNILKAEVEGENQ